MYEQVLQKILFAGSTSFWSHSSWAAPSSKGEISLASWAYRKTIKVSVRDRQDNLLWVNEITKEGLASVQRKMKK